MGDISVPLITFDSSSWVKIEDVGAIAKLKAQAQLSHDPTFVSHIDAGQAVLQDLVDKGKGSVYGVTTGFGERCHVTLSKEQARQLPSKLITYHGIGTGQYFNEEDTRAILVARLTSLSKGYSGVRFVLLERVEQLIRNDVLPRIPQEGSVGASGDLTPLSYVAAVIQGDRQVWYHGNVVDTEAVFSKVGITPLALTMKESLAIMNGTSVMTGIACLAYLRASYLSQLASRLTALAIVGLNGNNFHYDQTLFLAKPQAGIQLVAARIRSDLSIIGPRGDANPPITKHGRIEDCYSLRCAPHVIGVLEDLLPFLRQLIESELNSANDNPLISVENKAVYHGGHFYGGHIAMAMDTLKVQVANVADLLDRQLACLVDPKFNNGLPANLTGAEDQCINHGLKALQISSSAWTAEALKGTLPASIFSRSTECHNQDKVSLGTIAARDAIRVIQLTEQVAGAVAIAVRQAVEIRRRLGDAYAMSADADAFYGHLCGQLDFITEDVYLEPRFKALVKGFQDQRWDILYSKRFDDI